MRKSGAATRSTKKKQFVLRTMKTEGGLRSVTYKAPQMWNELSKSTQDITELRLFKTAIKQHVNSINSKGENLNQNLNQSKNQSQNQDQSRN